MPDFMEEVEHQQMFRSRKSDNSMYLFQASGSSGRNPQKLAQILTAYDFLINTLKWQLKPIANLTKFLTQYQASVDAKYHDDYKDVQIAEEIERRREERKGISILQS